MKNILIGIKKNVVVMGIASLLTDISSEMLYPVIPIFITTTLGAPVSAVGLIEGIAEATASILKAISGFYSDVIKKRRPFIVTGYFASSIAKPILFFAYTWYAVLFARLIDRIGKGIRTSPRDAMIADVTSAEYRGKAFGFHRGMDSIGACLGPLLAILFLTHSRDNLRPVFLLAFIPAIISVAILLFFLKESESLTKIRGVISTIDYKKVSPELIKFLAISSLFAIGNSSDAFLVLRSKDLGLGMIMVILSYVSFNIVYSLLSTPLGALSDSISRKSVLIFGFIMFAVVYAGFGMANSQHIVWLLFPIYGIFMSLTEGVGKAYISDIVPADMIGTALGIYNCILGVFTFFASLIAGLLWVNMGPRAPFYYGASTSLISALLFFIIMRKDMPCQKQL